MSGTAANTRMELLRIARELVINEYIDKRAQDHNNWLTQSDIVWKTKGVKLPYPVFPPYPTEADIIMRANTLEQYLNRPEATTVEATPMPDTAVTSIVVPAPADIKAFDDGGSLLAAPPTETKKEIKESTKTGIDNLTSVLPSWLTKNNGDTK